METKEGNIIETFETPVGMITAEIADPSRKIISDSEEQKPKKPLKIGGRYFRNLTWNDLFNSKIVNKLFTNFAVNELGVSPIAPNPEDPSESIGMWVNITDNTTGRMYSDVIIRKSVGHLLVIMFVVLTCSNLKDKRGHTYSFTTIKGTEELYENFVTRVEEETTENIKNYFSFMGGLLEATVESKATSPEKVFKCINDIVNWTDD